MKKRLATLLLAAVMAVSCMVLPAGAAETARFSDVSDQSTANEAEVLRLMGVLDGYADGTFRPETQLNRGQFCKMATYAMDAGKEVGRYRTVTVFPDVKPSHWAAPYINTAAKGKNIISGYPDGLFHPERTITVGQAVTILLRILGYKDEDVGGVWPESYMAVGEICGLTEGISAGGNAPLTRRQAAKLFVNLLQAEGPKGGTLYTLSEETDLISVDGGAGTMKTTKDTYTMANSVSSTTLTGTRGRVVLSGDRALTFLPSSATSTGISSAAVVLYADRSSAGLSALAGNNNYRIYKNGSLAGAGDLRKNDVATYYPATNSILVCDTRVTVYYESCDPSPSAPTKITALGGTEFYVLPTARDSLAAFRPGDQMTLLLTADGQVAAAVKADGGAARSNAVAVVSESGAIQMLCGSTVIQVSAKADEKYHGQVVRIASADKNSVSMSALSGGVGGDLSVTNRTLGSRSLASNVQVFRGGELTSLGQLSGSVIYSSRIKYARANWAGEVDLIVLDGGTDEIFGRVFWESERSPVLGENNEPTGEYTYDERIGVETSTKRYGPFRMRYAVQNGDCVAVTLNSRGTGFASLVELTELKNVSSSAWIGDTAVTFGGRTYEVPSDVQCYNLDSKDWITLEQARAYDTRATLHVKDGMVRIIEVGG